ELSERGAHGDTADLVLLTQSIDGGQALARPQDTALDLSGDVIDQILGQGRLAHFSPCHYALGTLPDAYTQSGQDGEIVYTHYTPGFPRCQEDYKKGQIVSGRAVFST